MKKILALLLCVLMLIPFTGCSLIDDISTEADTEDPDAFESTENNGETEETEFVYNEDYVSEHLGEHYSVTYKFTYQGEGESTETVMIMLKKNASGYYYKLSDGSEFMYLKEGDSYVVCTKDEETGNFVKMTDFTMSEEDVKIAAESVVAYLNFYDDYASELERDGSATVCGRSCEKYSMSSFGLGSSAKIEFYIDKQTGACLKYAVSAAISGESGSFVFECVEFDLGNVTLPSCN